ncbi:MAG TPA: hypothetical protein VGN63_12530 [Flavisolibacter sp.]|jgi:hypothetical protein|nr:hypothetical protein [Flavisolibacter sp.]
MKKMQSGMLALLLLCGFVSCQKNIASEELSLASAKPQTSDPVQTIPDGFPVGSCHDCVADFAATTETAVTNGVLTLDGSSLTPSGTTVTTIANTQQTYTVGNVVVTVSHDAANVYFTFERNNTNGKFGNIRFYSPAVVPVPTTGNGNKAGYETEVSKIQVVRSRASMAACSSISFSFNVSGGGNATVAGDVTSGALSYVLRDVCPPACTIEIGDYRTHSRGYWRNNDGQAFLTANTSLFDVTIGDGDHTESFSTPSSVKTFLESKPVANGTPGVLPNGGTYAAQVLSLALNLKADEQIEDYSAAAGKLGNLVVAIDEADIAAHPTWAQLTIWNGMSVDEIFAVAQQVLGGTETKYSPSHMNMLVTAINEAYEDGTVDTGFLSCGK